MEAAPNQAGLSSGMNATGPPGSGNSNTSASSSSSAARKRKAPHEYSTNPNTLRVRARNAKLSPYRRAVERARSNDLKAVSKAWKEQIGDEAFAAASTSAKKKILEEVEREVMERRRRKGIDADSRVVALNQRVRPDESVPAPRAGVLGGGGDGEGDEMPVMARPGYVAFPTPPIPDLMVVPETASPGIEDVAGALPVAVPAVPAVPARDDVLRSSLATLHAEDDTPRAAQSSSSSHSHHELNAAIEELKKQLEKERRRHEDEEERREAGMQRLIGMVEGMSGHIRRFTSTFQTIMQPIPVPAPAHLAPPALPETRARRAGRQVRWSDLNEDEIDDDGDRDSYTADEERV